MRLPILLLIALLGLTSSGFAAAKNSPDAGDFLCDHAPAGTVPAVPPPFDRWLVVVCSSEGQALVPIEGMAWVTHGTRDLVSILALPPSSAPIPPEPEYDPRYRVRFKNLFATEVKDAKAVRIQGFLAKALGKASSPPIDRVFQLDAVSSIYDLRYNIYFYIRNRRPVMGLVCLGQCGEAMVMDILTTDEMKKLSR